MAKSREPAADAQREMMSTREVADYLRIKERKVYELVSAKQIPCTRVTGKWLFPKRLIDLWAAQHTEYALVNDATPAAPVVAGSHDPLLDWALRESRCGLALQTGGSLDGLKRLAKGQATMAGLHVLDADSATYNIPVVRASLAGRDIVLLGWVLREQGLLLRQSDSRRIQSLADVARSRARMVMRQPEAGSQILFNYLLSRDGVKPTDIVRTPHAALNQTDLGLAIVEGKADVGLGVRAVATQFRLDFHPLHEERFDLVMRRVDYFEPPLQKFFAFARSQEFAKRAAEFGGYNIERLGEVVYNGE
jgi:excisionase family DNA binding protein